MTNIRYELVRWGTIGTVQYRLELRPDLQLLPDARVIAVGSRSPVSADDLGERLGIPCRYGSYEQLADDPEIGAVFIATPGETHADRDAANC
jgi:predicted dehydrogenase